MMAMLPTAGTHTGAGFDGVGAASYLAGHPYPLFDSAQGVAQGQYRPLDTAESI